MGTSIFLILPLDKMPVVWYNGINKDKKEACSDDTSRENEKKTEKKSSC